MKKAIRLLTLILLAGLYSCQSAGDTAASKNNPEHVIVYHAEGRFAGWPANNGIWKFENDEVLVGFTEAEYVLQEGHNAGEPYLSWLARTKDGGDTWTATDPENYVGDFGDEPEKSVPESPINFSRDGFAMRVVGNAYHGANDPGGHFFYSYDSGNTWKGPYSFGAILEFPEIKKYSMTELTPRTDYLVTGQNSCIVFMSTRIRGKFGQDRLFCVETNDGGKSFQFLGWVIKPFEEKDPENSGKVQLTDDPEKNPYPTQCRAVMSHSILMDNGEIISVMRRKFEMDRNYNWIDAYKSVDGGKTWHFLSRVGDTGLGNGNPPSITLTKDGYLCVVYGERTRGTIQAVLSEDKGKTWSEPRILMDGFWSEDMEFGDLGYPRVFCRSDGRLVAVYYYSTKDHPHHLRATIFEP